jgi:hypothetical protein
LASEFGTIGIKTETVEDIKTETMDGAIRRKDAKVKQRRYMMLCFLQLCLGGMKPRSTSQPTIIYK